jgi:hypothetical protein
MEQNKQKKKMDRWMLQLESANKAYAIRINEIAAKFWESRKAVKGGALT